MMGLFHRTALWLYILCGALSLVGLVIGNEMSQKVDQVAFGRLLLGLMCVCAVLMFASASGLGAGAG